MADKTTRPASHSPANLLAGFSRGRIGLWLAVSMVAHGLFIFLLSLGYIQDRWIDPNGAILRKEAAEAAQQELLKASAKSAPPAVKSTAPAPATTANPENPAADKPAPAVSAKPADEAIPADRKNSEAVKAITEVAAPSEIPTQPGDSSALLDDALKR